MKILTVFKKELLDVLRDKRTIMTMVVLPTFMIPLLLALVGNFSSSQSKKAQEKELKIALISNNNGNDLIQSIEQDKKITFVKNINPEDFNQLIKDDSLDMAIVISPDFDSTIAQNKSAQIDLHYNSTSLGIKARIDQYIKVYKTKIINEKLHQLGVTPEAIEPLKINNKDVFTKEESIGKLAGGFLPYLFVLFCFFGCMYPAIDLFAGEKERGTMETILSTPISRFQLLFGKMLVVALAGVLSGSLALLGIYLSTFMGDALPPGLGSVVTGILNPTSAIMIVLMLIPLSVFLASILIGLSIYAKSFKEAQSLVVPAQFVVLLPLIIGILPGIKLTFATALVPVLNVALASKEIIAGTIVISHFIILVVSLIAIGVLGIYLCSLWFGKESNVLS